MNSEQSLEGYSPHLILLNNEHMLAFLGLVTFVKSREVKGRIINTTIRRNPSGKYFVSILVETEVQPLHKTGTSIGIDVGLKDFAVLSDLTVYRNPKFFRLGIPHFNESVFLS